MSVDAQAVDGATSSQAVANESLEQRIVDALRTIYDPEIPVNIYDLGLIYGIDVLPLGRVSVRMTLTSPSCPAAESLPPEVKEKVAGVEGVVEASVEIVWEPPWDPSRMSEETRLELNLL